MTVGRRETKWLFLRSHSSSVIFFCNTVAQMLPRGNNLHFCDFLRNLENEVNRQNIFFVTAAEKRGFAAGSAISVEGTVMLSWFHTVVMCNFKSSCKCIFLFRIISNQNDISSQLMIDLWVCVCVCHLEPSAVIYWSKSIWSLENSVNHRMFRQSSRRTSEGKPENIVSIKYDQGE